MVSAGDPQIRILVADDHPIVREGLRGLIAVQPDIVVVAEASNGHEALAVYRKALGEGVEKYLQGAPVKPVDRRLN